MGKKKSFEIVPGLMDIHEAKIEAESTASPDFPKGSAAGESPPSNQRTQSSRERKNQRGETLRRRNIGFSVGHINVEPHTNNRKIKFDEVDIIHDDTEPATKIETSFSVKDDDNDESIEEIKASVAKDQVLQQIAQEEATAQDEILLTKKSKKKKQDQKNHVNTSENDDDNKEEDSLDDALLDLVDSGTKLQQNRIAKQEKLQTASKIRNTHITFKLGADDDMLTLNNPAHAGQNIQLVVLPNLETTAGTSPTSESLGITPSRTALNLCRNRLTAEKTLMLNEGKKEPGVHRDGQIVKRSRKSKYYMRLGRSAANFKVNTK